MRKEALLSVKSLLSVLLQERSLRSRSASRDVVLHESETWLMLLSTVEGFIKDKDILGTINSRGVDVNRLQRHLASTRDWITYWRTLATNQQLTDQEYQRYVKYTDMVLTKTSDTLDQLLQQEKVYRTRPQDWLRNAAAGLLLTIAGYTGIGMNAAYAQETTLARGEPNPYATTETKTNTQRDYVKELQERVNKIEIEVNQTPSWYGNRCAQLSRDNKIDEAIAYGLRAISIDKSLDSAYTSLATAFSKKGDILKKQGEEQKALQLYSQGEEYARTGLQLFEEREKRTKVKLSDSVRAVKYSSLGALCAKLGKKDAAIKYLTESVRLDPTLKGVKEHLNYLTSN